MLKMKKDGYITFSAAGNVFSRVTEKGQCVKWLFEQIWEDPMGYTVESVNSTHYSCKPWLLGETAAFLSGSEVCEKKTFSCIDFRTTTIFFNKGSFWILIEMIQFSAFRCT